MTAPYRRYAAAPERAILPLCQHSSVLRLPSSVFVKMTCSAGLASNHLWGSSDLRGASVDYLHSDVIPLRSGSYGLDDVAGISNRAAPGLPGLTTGTGAKGFPTSFEDSTLIGQRRDPALGITPGITSGISDILPERSSFSRNTDGLSADDSNILFVDGLPNDCSRREVAHLFRPFIGFKEIRVIHREPRKSGDKALVLCFVEFNDPKCARTALQALQGYKFDDKKPDALPLRIQFAQFPFRPSAAPDDRRLGSVR